LSNTKPRGRRGAVLLALAAGMIVAAAPAAAQAAPPPGKVKVMTRNVYLGADLTPAIQAADAQDLALKSALIVNTVDATDFPTRAKLLAAEIKKNRPDLVGLQEVALWRMDLNNGNDVVQEPIDINPDPDGPITAATEVRYDFLALLNKQLRKKDVDYRVVDVQREFDIETPLASGGDGRLTMRDVILARDGKKAGVRTRFEDSDHYEDRLQVVVAGLLSVNVWRGWQYTDAKVRGTSFRFLNTHLEAFDNGNNGGVDQGTIREAQAESLIAPLTASTSPGPATEQSAGTPVIAAGDFNSDDDTVGNDGDVLAYNALTDDGNPRRLFELTTGPTAPGADGSCCFSGHGGQDGIFSGLLADMDHQVDHIFASDPDIEPLKTVVVGQEPAVFDKFDMWPSDHSGLVTTVQFPTP
jgi:endonuclease/exonuclease/phosphatase family metal-dependent hydrolase